MGKRKSVEANGEAADADSADSPSKRNAAAGGEGETDSPAGRARRDRKVVKAFDPSKASTDSPSAPKKAKTVKKTEPDVTDYVPDEKEQFGTFIVQVDNEWRDVKGFRVWEYKGAVKEIGAKTQFNKAREWYCSKQVEPPGGFKPGQQGFCPAGQHAWNAVKLPTNSFVEVQVLHKIMDWGTYSRKFIEIVGEQERVAEAYAKHPPDEVSHEAGNDENEDGEGKDDEGGDDEEKEASPKKKGTPKKGGGKAPTAYLLFVNSRRSELMTEFPGITVPQLGVKCGELWRAMTPEEKQEFQHKAQALAKEREASGEGGGSSKKRAKSSGGDGEGAEAKPKRGRKPKAAAAAAESEENAEEPAEGGEEGAVAGEGGEGEAAAGGEGEAAAEGEGEAAAATADAVEGAVVEGDSAEAAEAKVQGEGGEEAAEVEGGVGAKAEDAAEGMDAEARDGTVALDADAAAAEEV